MPLSIPGMIKLSQRQPARSSPSSARGMGIADFLLPLKLPFILSYHFSKLLQHSAPCISPNF